MGASSSKVYACNDENDITDVVDEFVNDRIANVIKLKTKPSQNFSNLSNVHQPNITIDDLLVDGGVNSAPKPPLSNATSIKSRRSYLSVNSLSSFACRQYLKQENSYIPNEAVSFSLRRQPSNGKLGFENSGASWKSGSDISESLFAITEGVVIDGTVSNPISNYNKRSTSKLEIQDDADWIPVSDDECEMDNSIEESYSSSMNSMIIFENKGNPIPIPAINNAIPPLVLNNNTAPIKPNLAPTFNKPPQLVLNISPIEVDNHPDVNKKHNGLQNNQSYMFTHSGTMLVDGLGAAIGKTGMQHTNPVIGTKRVYNNNAALSVSLPMKERLIVLCKLGSGASSIVYKVYIIPHVYMYICILMQYVALRHWISMICVWLR